MIHGGKEYLNLCSNSYLSLHLHPAVMAAARSAR
jgi:7-keto-8-aminopelargonate synthetase-like enzyme